jgi:hypothetical protein
MWQINSVEAKPAILDFGSSGQNKIHVVQLFSDGVKLVNELELVDWDAEETQVLICEACGYTHCKSGDWVSFRKSDSIVLLLPTADYVWGDREDKVEYGPPYYLKQQGIPYLSFSTYETLRSVHSSLPSLDRFHRLNLKEAALLFHWNAPLHVLGEPPAVNARRNIVVGSSELDHLEQFERLIHLLQLQYEDNSFAQLRPLLSTERVVSFYLDGADFIEWEAMVFDGSEYRLLIDSKYVIVAVEAT